MADFCPTIGNLREKREVAGARETLGRLEHEFDWVKNEIELESLTF
jgi:hypothetical protein